MDHTASFYLLAGLTAGSFLTLVGISRKEPPKPEVVPARSPEDLEAERLKAGVAKRWEELTLKKAAWYKSLNKQVDEIASHVTNGIYNSNEYNRVVVRDWDVLYQPGNQIKAVCDVELAIQDLFFKKYDKTITCNCGYSLINSENIIRCVWSFHKP